MLEFHYNSVSVNLSVKLPSHVTNVLVQDVFVSFCFFLFPLPRAQNVQPTAGSNLFTSVYLKFFTPRGGKKHTLHLHRHLSILSFTSFSTCLSTCSAVCVLPDRKSGSFAPRVRVAIYILRTQRRVTS